ncbi:MAG: glucosaminidase domain-containing protein [Bacilli bacterium]|nr:glucosaminidase domain-containing protein [Bacilli bacterium]
MNSRVKRNSHKYKKNRRIKRFKLIKKIIKIIIKVFLALINLTFNILYKIMYFIHNLIAKLFMKLPRMLKIAIIYVLVFNLVGDIYNTYNTNYTIKEVKAKTILTSKVPIIKEIEEPKVEKCIFDSVSCKIAESGKKIGLTEEQILISIAISKWETGNYTSAAYKEKNNFGGVMCRTGLRTYSNQEEGINHFLTNLKNNYFDLGLDTLEKIQPKYCPIGAKNDPTGLNKNWLSGTNKMLNELKSK